VSGSSPSGEHVLHFPVGRLKEYFFSSLNVHLRRGHVSDSTHDTHLRVLSGRRAGSRRFDTKKKEAENRYRGFFGQSVDIG
jgi:hypothetical protein